MDDYQEKSRLAKEALDSGYYDKETIEYIFPELKESEDERIRKEIIRIVDIWTNSCPTVNGIPAEALLAWLEKQGEKKNVEPKFRAGNWYLCVKDFLGKGVRFDKGKAYHCGKNGCLQEFDSGAHICIVEELYEYFRPWTTQDAKDGDVLCDYCEAYDNPLIFILNKFERVNFGLARPSDYSSYCFLTAGDRQKFKEGTYHHEHDIKPATKEQRDLLFSKMKEAGYEWDAEKKELKDIKEQNSTEDNCKISECDIKVDMDEYNKGFECGKQRVLKYPEEFNLCEKSSFTWSSEDEKMIDAVIADIQFTQKVHTHEVDQVVYERKIDWLKSLKDRVQPQPKQELSWSEEDERNVSIAIQYVYEHGYFSVMNWLKSLKERHTWKPSDEQMEALYTYIYNPQYFNSPDPRMELVESVYKDLKKLKEE